MAIEQCPRADSDLPGSGEKTKGQLSSGFLPPIVRNISPSATLLRRGGSRLAWLCAATVGRSIASTSDKGRTFNTVMTWSRSAKALEEDSTAPGKGKGRIPPTVLPSRGGTAEQTRSIPLQRAVLISKLLVVPANAPTKL